MPTRAELLAGGMSERELAAAIREGALIRVRRGVYVSRHTDASVIAAARLGALTCCSALALHGVWTIPDPVAHVRVGGDSRIAARQGYRLHRTGTAPRTVIESPLSAMRQFVRCGHDLEIVVAIDSALNKGVLGQRDIQRMLDTSNRGRRILSRIDSRAESGTETIVRVRLRARGIKLRTQVRIAGVGRVDLVVGDRLVIEVDGEQWHDRASTFESDRRRDTALVVRGYVVLRYSYRRVMHDWDAVEGEVLNLIRRDAHVARGGYFARSNA
jgi:very-short-patch-repair endonuclease